MEIHPEIKKFWEDSGGRVWVQTEPHPAYVGLEDCPAYWFDQNGARRLIAVPRGSNKELVYWIDSKWKWVSGDIALKLVRLKAFL